MPLKLVLGPANSAKARVVLDAYQSRAARDPLLVVPTFPDVDRYRRELAARGMVFGARVVRFAGLLDEAARRHGVGGRPLGRLARERVAAAAVARTQLRVLGAAAATPGFLPALLSLIDELEERRIDPARWYAALRAWAPTRHGEHADYAEDLAALYAGYRRGLEAVGRDDRPLYTARVLDALRLDPGRWGATPVMLYGFDDFGPQQLDAIETLATRCGADVIVSLPYEPRAAFSGRAGTVEDLRGLAAEVEVCPPRAKHYTPRSRAALHHLERGLFGALDQPPAKQSGDGSPRPGAGDAILLLEGGGQRPELELVGAHVARLLREGMPGDEIAVVLREPDRHAPLIAQVFGAYGIPYALDRRLPAGHTAVGRALLGLARCALLGGEATADDLLTWLRAPGVLRVPALADRLEADVRRRGLRTAAAARTLWEERHWPLDAFDRVAAAAASRGLCDALRAELRGIFAAPFRRRAHVLGATELDDARAARALSDALAELGGLASGPPELVPQAAELLRLLADVPVFVADPPRPGAVVVADPLGIRARRVRALFVCGLQEGEFPRPAPAQPFLGDAERRAINAASGLRLPLGGDRMARERSLFYAAASRPTELLALSWRAGDDDGTPAVRSLFVDDVLDLFDPALARSVQVRELGAAGWPAGLAPTAREARRVEWARTGPEAQDPISPLQHPAVLAALQARAAWSASALEAWVACPVKWFVERFLRPDELQPDPEPVVRGELAHRVLEEALRALQAQAGGPLRPERLDEAKRQARAALERLAAEHPLSVNPERMRAALRRLEADIARYLEHAAHAGSSFAPTEFELRFGAPEDPLPAVAVGERGLRLQGRIDRVDVAPGGRGAIVYDYKGKAAAPQARWEQDGKLQLALYMLALPGLLGLEAEGGLYQPLGAKDMRARGLLRDVADPALVTVDTDRVEEARFAEALAAALDAAERAAAEIRAGELVPRPETCGWKGGGCSYPSICRCVGT